MSAFRALAAVVDGVGLSWLVNEVESTIARGIPLDMEGHDPNQGGAGARVYTDAEATRILCDAIRRAVVEPARLGRAIEADLTSVGYSAEGISFASDLGDRQPIDAWVPSIEIAVEIRELLDSYEATLRDR